MSANELSATIVHEGRFWFAIINGQRCGSFPSEAAALEFVERMRRIGGVHRTGSRRS